MNTKKTTRRRGELLALIERLTAKHGELTPAQLAEMANITQHNARNALDRYRTKQRESKSAPKGRALVAEGSALNRLVGPMAHSIAEKRFIAAVHLLGLARAEELLNAERTRINRDMAGAA